MSPTSCVIYKVGVAVSVSKCRNYFTTWSTRLILASSAAPAPSFQCRSFTLESTESWEGPGDEANKVKPILIHLLCAHSRFKLWNSISSLVILLTSFNFKSKYKLSEVANTYILLEGAGRGRGSIAWAPTKNLSAQLVFILLTPRK